MTIQLGIYSVGMVTGAGLSAPASCAAIRAGLDNFHETKFMSRAGKWVVGSEVPFDKRLSGLKKLVRMVASAIYECLQTLDHEQRSDSAYPVIVCIAEQERAGELTGLDDSLLFAISQEIGIRFHLDSMVVAQGRVGAAVALLSARTLIHERHHSAVIVAAVDSYLTWGTLTALEEGHRLMTSRNWDGFIPGEGAAAILIGCAAPHTTARLIFRGIGFGRESATIESAQPLRGDGMVQAIRNALGEAKARLEDVTHRISDLSGEQYRFREVALSVNRILRQRKESLGIWHPADSLGEIGAAALPAILAVLFYGAQKNYLPGSTVLALISNDDDKRAALIVTAEAEV
jgi:3-oxoacyl-[acyl-carrier-protein] synthase I